MTKEQKLQLWQGRLATNASAFSKERDKMDARELLYRGDGEMEAFTEATRSKQIYNRAYHVRNLVAENIESMIDSNIPQPKVTPRRKEDEPLAEIIENMIRNELDRMPMEEINDITERMTPIQGASFYHVEWDHTAVSHGADGEVAITAVHPKQVVPQNGVTTSLEDMDYVIIAVPQTKAYILAHYGKEVDNDGEDMPQIRGLDDEMSSAEDMVTQYIAYYKDEDGNIGRFSWVGDTVLEDLEDYQARRRRRCVKCGEPEPHYIEPESLKQPDASEQMRAQQMMDFSAQFGLDDETPKLDTYTPSKREKRKKRCPNCGGTEFEDAPSDVEEVFAPITLSDGTVIPGAVNGIGKDGQPVVVPNRIPAYKPGMFPIVMQRNVTVYGQLLGDSDVDKIADQQNAVNWIQRKIDERLLDAGTIITLPPDVRAYRDPDDHKVYRVESQADAMMIHTYEFTGDLQYYYSQLALDYESSRQILGITDSYQGRRDTTATSGTAKQFAAAQSAGRLESKRRMKQAAYAKLFELIFKFRLAYADEPRPVVYQDGNGNPVYDAFDRYKFLESETHEDGSTTYYWNDQFLFSCDTSAPLASNREALWQEARMNFQTGAYGDPASIDTLILFWTEMERLHYPLAAEAKRALQERLAQQQAMMQQMPMMPPEGSPAPQEQASQIGMNAPQSNRQSERVHRQQTPQRPVPLSGAGV